MHRLLALLLVAVGGCGTNPEPPQALDTWQIDAVDQSGVFGTITVERDALIRLPPGSRVADHNPGAARGLLVLLTYQPDRASDSGFGAFDWDARGRAARVPGIAGLDSGANWPVDGTLPTRLPGSDRFIGGWMVIPVTEADLRQPITLLYVPIIADEPEAIAEIVVYAP